MTKKNYTDEEFIEAVKPFGIEYFNPVVKNWTPKCQAIEEDEKNNKCDTHLYVITKEMMGTYSIAEIINSAWQSIIYGTTVNYVEELYKSIESKTLPTGSDVAYIDPDEYFDILKQNRNKSHL